MAKAEGELDKKAQKALEKMGVGPAAKLMERVTEKSGRIKNVKRYVMGAAKKKEKNRQEEAWQGDEEQGIGDQEEDEQEGDGGGEEGEREGGEGGEREEGGEGEGRRKTEEGRHRKRTPLILKILGLPIAHEGGTYL